MNKKIFSIILCFTITFSLFSFLAPSSFAALTFDIRESSVEIFDGENEGEISVLFNGELFSCLENQEILITGGNEYSETPTNNTIKVSGNIKVNLTVHNVNIESKEFVVAPLEISGTIGVTLKASGKNTFKAGSYMAAIQVWKMSSLTIIGNGTIYAIGGREAAGIGGGWRANTPHCDPGNITIKDFVTVYAVGGSYGAGIGGGITGHSGEIVIDGFSTVYATGGKEAASIGGGSDGDCNVTIKGNAKVEAGGSENYAGIGSGKNGNVSKIIITDNASVKAIGNASSPAIGASIGGKTTKIEILKNAVVRAKSSNDAAAIGSAKGCTVNQITISGSSNVFAIGGVFGAGIGSGSGGTCFALNISDRATVESYGGLNGAGIGSGDMGSATTIAISGSTNIMAFGGYCGAGIGSGSNASVRDIVISGFSSVKAVGGKYGAGIGSGLEGSVSSLLINENSTVISQGGNFGAGIGLGSTLNSAATLSNIVLTITDEAVVKAAGGFAAAGLGGGYKNVGIIIRITKNASVESASDVLLHFDDPNVLPKTENEIFESQPNTNEDVPETDTTLPSLLKNTFYPNESVFFEEGALQTTPSTIHATKKTVKPPMGFGVIDFITANVQIKDPNGILEAINYEFPYSNVNLTENESKFEIINPAKDVGNGANCLVEGLCYVTDNATLNGKYGELTVTLVIGGNEDDILTSIAKGEKYTLPESIERTGYKFLGWYDSPSYQIKAEGEITVEANLVLYAKWEAISINTDSSVELKTIVGTSVSHTFEIKNGTGDISCAITAGSLPNGMQLDSKSATVMGIPTKPGIFSCEITISDKNGSSKTVSFTMHVYTPIAYDFTFTTGDSSGAATNSDIFMYFSYIDRITGKEAMTEKINITESLKKLTDKPLQRGATETIQLLFDANVGQPRSLHFLNESEDGWFLQTVVISFSGDSTASAFSQKYTANSWFGPRDDNSFLSYGVIFVIISIAVILGAIITFFAIIRYKNCKRRNVTFFLQKKKG